MIRAARLVRVSSRGQAADDRTSLATQTQSLTALCRERGWISDEEDLFVEVVSGAKGLANRLVLSGLMDHIAAGRYQRLCVLDFDRSTRKGLGEWEEIKEILAASGCSMVINGQEYDLTQSGARLVTGIQATVAQFERERLIERIVRGFEAKAATGHLVIGRIPYGYRSVYHDQGDGKLPPRTIEIQPDQAAVVRRVFELFAEGSLGTQGIAHRLNADGHRWIAGQEFSWWVIKRMLQNPVYCGRYVRRRDYTRHAHSTRLTPVEVDSKVFAPIVTQDLWERCQAVREARPRSRAPGVKQHPLSGLLRCPSCGDGMMAHYCSDRLKTGGRRIRLYYRCYRRQRKRGECAAPQQVLMASAHEAVLEFLRVVLAFDLPVEAEADPGDDHLADLREELARLDGKERALLERLGRPVEDGGVRGDQFARANTAILARRDAIEAEIKKLARSHVKVLPDMPSMAEVLDQIAPEDPRLGVIARSLFTEIKLERVSGRLFRVRSATVVNGMEISV